MPEVKSSSTLAVVIAARDASKFIAATLDSLVEQTRQPDQVVIYDDGSTDGTAEIARHYEDKLRNLSVIEGGTSVGISAARNRANAIVQTEFIAVLDADDTFLPETIDLYLDFLEANPGTDLIYADTKVFDEEMKRGTLRRYPGFLTDQEAIRKTLGSALIPFKHSSMVYSRETIALLGGYDESLPIKVDVDLFLRFFANRKKVLKLDQTTSCHRKHDRQISTKRLYGMKIYHRLIQTYEPDPVRRGLLLSTRIPFEFAKLLLRG